MSFEPVAYDLSRLHAGDVVTITGSARTSFDGTIFDATTHTDDTGLHAGGFYALDGTGLRIVEQNAASHDAKLVVTGDDGPACHALGMASPCLLPRTKELAHERLLTEHEFAQSLTGTLAVDVPVNAPRPLVEVSHRTTRAVGVVGVLLLLALAGLAMLRARAARRAEPIGQVRIAAAEALRRAPRNDATLAAARARIADLVAKAEGIEAARLSCARRLAKIDRTAVAKKRAAWATSHSPGAREAAQWIEAEERETNRLVNAHAEALAALEQIAASLRVASLRVDDGGLRVAEETVRDAAHHLHEELTLREDAAAEAERVTQRTR